MKLLLLEYRLLRKDFIKIIFSTLVVSILNIMIYARNGIIHSGASSSEVLRSLFGSAYHLYMNWIYWIILCVGYLLLLQIVWKSRIDRFEINQLLRYKNTNWFWLIKFVTGFLFTCFYVCCSLLVTWISCLLLHARMIWDPAWLIIFLYVTLTLYWHALLWLTIKVYSLVEAANIVVMILFYAGVRVAQPFIPLYYGMFDNIHRFPIMTLIAECMAIAVLGMLILRKAKKMDYF
ncbi:hypothetical protein [Paenibacillus sp. OSY-SE]|uniref:hypothetical protein n=1 Tax=Paenibacillus sp. OSY-SE TaxID=1196323 RepID=UPI0002F1E407|nr:hypothetical protein [Paenibacillus sp. OSY-SE]